MSGCYVSDTMPNVSDNLQPEIIVSFEYLVASVGADYTILIQIISGCIAYPN